MVKCDGCPCLLLKIPDYSESLTECPWWICRIDDYQIEFCNIQRDKVIRHKNCLLSRIELKDGTVYEPEVIDE